MPNFEALDLEPSEQQPPVESTPAPATKEVVEEPTPNESASPATSEPSALAVPPPDASKAELEAYRTAMLNERHKRQVLENELAYFRGKAEALPKQNDDVVKARRKEQETAFLNDPVGYAERIAEERAQNLLFQDRWERSVDWVTRKHKDWSEKEQRFMGLIQNDPSLAERARRHPYPARFVHEYVTEIDNKDTQAPVDLEAYRKKVREEVEAELRQKLALETAEKNPKTLASVPSAGKSAAKSDNPDFDEMLARKPF